MSESLADRIVRLRGLAAKAQQMNADATAAVGYARHQLEQIDGELKAAGINPENAEQEVAALEAQLDTTTRELETQLTAEIAELTRITDLARQAQLIR